MVIPERITKLIRAVTETQVGRVASPLEQHVRNRTQICDESVII